MSHGISSRPICDTVVPGTEVIGKPPDPQVIPINNVEQEIKLVNEEEEKRKKLEEENKKKKEEEEKAKEQKVQDKSRPVSSTPVPGTPW